MEIIATKKSNCPLAKEILQTFSFVVQRQCLIILNTDFLTFYLTVLKTFINDIYDDSIYKNVKRNIFFYEVTVEIAEPIIIFFHSRIDGGRIS